MQQTTLGRTGLSVGRLGLGGVFIASYAAAPDQARATVHRALELGVNLIDTAPCYGNSEEVLGQALDGIAAPVVLSTKIGYRPQPFRAKDKRVLRACFDESLRLLRRESVDILMIHEPDRPRQFDWWDDWLNVEGPIVELFEELKAEGRIRYTGLGGTTTTELAHLCRSGKFDVVLTTFQYSLLFREALHEVIPAAREAGMGIIAGAVLQQGVLSRRYDQQISSPAAHWLSKPRREQLRALYVLCDELGLALPELCIRFVLGNPDIHCALVGANSVSQVEDNVKAANAGPLPADVLARLDEIAAMVPFRPYGEPLTLGAYLDDPAIYKGQGSI